MTHMDMNVAKLEKRIYELNRQIAKLGALKADLMILANDADNILAHGVVEDCEDVVIRFLHLAEHYCGMHFEGLPE